MPVLYRGVLLVLVWLVPLGVLVQAGTAAPTVLFIRGSLGMHGSLSYLVLAAAVGVVFFVWVLRLGWGAVTMALLAVIGLAAQTVLGFAARGSRIADHEPVGAEGGLAVIHVALGMFLLVFTLAVAFKVMRELRVERIAREWTVGEYDGYGGYEGDDEYGGYDGAR